MIIIKSSRLNDIALGTWNTPIFWKHRLALFLICFLLLYRCADVYMFPYFHTVQNINVLMTIFSHKSTSELNYSTNFYVRTYFITFLRIFFRTHFKQLATVTIFMRHDQMKIGIKKSWIHNVTIIHTFLNEGTLI